MQTVYILNGCNNSTHALNKLKRSPDMTTLIIILSKSQEKILRLDKRVKTFPFIINTPPTRQGLIPKRALVMSFGKAIKVSQGAQKNKSVRKNTGLSKGKTVVIPLQKPRGIKIPAPTVLPRTFQTLSRQRVPVKGKKHPPVKSKPQLPNKMKPVAKSMDYKIKKVKNNDGYDLILDRIN